MIKLSDVPFFISEKCFHLPRTENVFFKSGKHKAVNVSTNVFFRVCYFGMKLNYVVYLILTKYHERKRNQTTSQEKTYFVLKTESTYTCCF